MLARVLCPHVYLISWSSAPTDAGFTTTVFAYGCTGSGKTHTITGTDDEPGILPRAVHLLFQRLQSDAATRSDKAFMVFLT